MQKLYIAIKDELLARIEDGTYPVGSTIPPETELAESYGVSRPTIRQALQLLVDAGYLDRKRRRGTIVCDPHAPQETKPVPVENSAETHLKMGHPHLSSHKEKHVKTATIRASKTHADQEVAEMLDVPVGEALFLFRILGSDAEGHVVEYSRTTYRGKDNSFEFSTEHGVPLDQE